MAVEHGHVETGEAPSPAARPAASRAIRVAIATPVRFYREGIADLLARRAHLELVGSLESGPELAALVVRRKVDVALLDLPVPEGPAIARDLRSLDPDLRIVALAAREQEDDVCAWAEAGTSGYVSCSSTIGEMVEAVETAARGEVACSPRIAGMLLRLVARTGPRTVADDAHATSHRHPTRRERQVAELIAQGLSNKQIAYTLGITLPTVKNHVSSIFDKLDVTTRHDVLASLGYERRARRVAPEVNLGY
jgi:DNA-binding NarL/FixJ family response regulator